MTVYPLTGTSLDGLESGRGPRKEIAMKILVTGATGTVGSEVAKALLQRGAEVRALTRKQPELGKLSDAVEITLGDLSDPVSVTQAMVGVDKLFLLIGNVADEFTQALTAYGLAKKAGLKHVTYLSVYQADRFLDVPHFAAKHAVEEAIREGGVPYTILRPGYFMQNDRRLKPLLTGPGVYPVPLGSQGIAVVDVRDIAEAAAISLTEEGHAGKTYDLVSSEMLSGPGAAAIWSRLLGKDVKYAGHADFDAFEAQLRKTGDPSWLAYDLRVMFQGFVERGFSHTESQTARFAALLGREPGKYSSYAQELTKQSTAALAPFRPATWGPERRSNEDCCVDRANPARDHLCRVCAEWLPSVPSAARDATSGHRVLRRLAASGFMLPLLFATQLIGGALLLLGMVPLGVVILAPGGLPLAIVVAALALFLAWTHRWAYRPLFAASVVQSASMGTPAEDARRRV